MPGPLPKPDAQRRRANKPLANTLKLPAGGRKGATPDWPLPALPSEHEASLWADLWRTPMAAAWERLEWGRVVARYVRALVRAEETFSPPILAEVRQLEDRLGMSPMALLRLRWEIVGDELAPARDKAKPRTRLKAVDDGAVAGS